MRPPKVLQFEKLRKCYNMPQQLYYDLNKLNYKHNIITMIQFIMYTRQKYLTVNL